MLRWPRPSFSAHCLLSRKINLLFFFPKGACRCSPSLSFAEPHLSDECPPRLRPQGGDTHANLWPLFCLILSLIPVVSQAHVAGDTVKLAWPLAPAGGNMHEPVSAVLARRALSISLACFPSFACFVFDRCAGALVSVRGSFLPGAEALPPPARSSEGRQSQSCCRDRRRERYPRGQ